MQTAGGQTTAVLLCGGAGHAMDGTERALLPVAGAPLARRVLDRLEPQVEAVVISCNKERKAWQAFGHPTVLDAPTDKGPLAGIMAAVYAARTPWVFACPGNAPNLPRNIVRLLYMAARRHDSGIAVPHDGERLQPLYMLFHRSRGRDLRDYLDLGRSQPCGFLERLQPAVLDASRIRETFQRVRGPADAKAVAANLAEASPS